MRLSFAIGDYDRVRALREGRVRADGLDLVFLPLGPEEIFFRQLVHQEFDASEMSLGSFVAGLSRGEVPPAATPRLPPRALPPFAPSCPPHPGLPEPADPRR